VARRNRYQFWHHSRPSKTCGQERPRSKIAAEYWIKEKLFSVPTPPPGETRPVFTLLLPPPNVTGRLHMGHMLNQTQMDIIVRWHRMRGFLTLWIGSLGYARPISRAAPAVTTS
jgi:valyl-tRNA synthetase